MNIEGNICDVSGVIPNTALVTHMARVTRVTYTVDIDGYGEVNVDAGDVYGVGKSCVVKVGPNVATLVSMCGGKA